MTQITPFDAMRVGMAMWRLGAEAQMVVGMRVLGLAGFWALPPGESWRMVSEKSPAWNDAYMAGGKALAKGASFAAATDAALAPLHRKASANRKRLSRISR